MADTSSYKEIIKHDTEKTYSSNTVAIEIDKDWNDVDKYYQQYTKQRSAPSKNTDEVQQLSCHIIDMQFFLKERFSKYGFLDQLDHLKPNFINTILKHVKVNKHIDDDCDDLNPDDEQNDAV